MIARTFYRLASLGLLILILGTAFAAVAASNTIPESGADESSRPITPNDLKPPECASLNLTSLVVGSGTINGGGGSSLILGSPGADTIKAQNGADCVLGGDGNDDLRGNGGNDVLLGGTGDDTLNGGAGIDVCYGGSGIDTFSATCETQIP